ncbi:MAG: hypothetical protein V1765_00500 [bacterium]
MEKIVETGIIVAVLTVVFGLVLTWRLYYLYRHRFQDKLVSLVIVAVPNNGAEDKFLSLTKDALERKFRFWGATVFTNGHRILSPSMYLPITFTLDIADHYETSEVKWRINCHDWLFSSGVYMLKEPVNSGFLEELAYHMAKQLSKNFWLMCKNRQIELDKEAEEARRETGVKVKTKTTTDVS